MDLSYQQEGFMSGMDFQPVQRRRLYQEVADRIEHVIRDGDLVEGESLPSERELTDQFAVGRRAIREAPALWRNRHQFGDSAPENRTL
jgi:DNA-binding FadR family transcriptional regulator